LEGLKGFEGSVVVALGSVDAALERLEEQLFAVAAPAEDGDGAQVAVGIRAGGAIAGVVSRLDGGEPAEEPGVTDDGVDEVAGFGCRGVEAIVILAGEGFEVFGAFAGNDERFGINAGFEGVAGGGAFAFGGDGSGRPLGVPTIRVDLLNAGYERVPFVFGQSKMKRTPGLRLAGDAVGSFKGVSVARGVAEL
jgi:hypothetical protein